ncbi:hypothetical protein DM860_009615 [Cuscuta australis]|uniref:Uncharacterized protein n=1 Tax=Cuscuta australis TaxID=267555 RepID=A0A328DNI1_9ASTE|nr:hypothetical protein DM860_009615 [Cuscuta australis]
MESQTNEIWRLGKDVGARQKELRTQIREHEEGMGSLSHVTMSRSKDTLANVIDGTSMIQNCNDVTNSARLQMNKRKRINYLSSITCALNFSEGIQSQGNEKWDMAKDARARRKDILLRKRVQNDVKCSSSMSHAISTTKRFPL